ncbi:hypothetical protein Cs7R123_07100 [Catellatospora sp. TT07R-123]|nr:hypothetical protein Cs7R123_07100 [Catellatospora sp. TT07R-123]
MREGGHHVILAACEDNRICGGAGHRLDPAASRRVFEEVLTRIGTRFARSEPRRTVRDLLVGLLAPIERKNGWRLADHPSPDRMQRLLRTAVWDTDAVAADLRDSWWNTSAIATESSCRTRRATSNCFVSRCS